MPTKIHSFQSEITENEYGVKGQYFERKYGDLIVRHFGSVDADEFGKRKVFYPVTEIPKGLKMIDDNINWENTHTYKVLHG